MLQIALKFGEIFWKFDGFGLRINSEIYGYLNTGLRANLLFYFAMIFYFS